MMDSDSRGMVVCCVFLGIPAVLLLSGPFIALHDAQSNICGPVQQDFIFLGSTCNITNISHTTTIIDETHEYCKDGGVPDQYGYCGSFNEEPISSGCEDRYTIYFTAGEDNHSVVHRSITRQRLRGVEDCGDSEPLQSTYVVGYKSSIDGFVDCWKPSPHLDTNLYLKQCGYHPSDRVCPSDYECGDSTCYKIVDPMEFCNLELQKIYHNMPFAMIFGGICFLVLLRGTFDYCKKNTLKKKRRRQEEDIISETECRNRNLTTSETSVEMTNIENID